MTQAQMVKLIFDMDTQIVKNYNHIKSEKEYITSLLGKTLTDMDVTRLELLKILIGFTQDLILQRTELGAKLLKEYGCTVVMPEVEL